MEIGCGGTLLKLQNDWSDASVHWVDRLTSSVVDLIESLSNRTSGRLTRMLRFMAGLSSDASEAFKAALDRAPPYRSDIAIALTEAMTQRLSVDEATVDGYAKYVRIVLETMVQNSEKIRFGALSTEVVVRRGDLSGVDESRHPLDGSQADRGSHRGPGSVVRGGGPSLGPAVPAGHGHRVSILASHLHRARA